jgi:type IV pilus assembly protein PilC
MQDLFQPASFSSVLTLLLGFVVYIVVGFAPALAALYAIYFLLTLPLRRNERARLFLDLLELGLASGRTPEVAIMDPAKCGDSVLGVRFLELARHIERGLPLGQALELVPRALPPQVRAMLNTGARLGDLRKVLPACRMSLREGVSEVRGALNYVVVLSFLATPVALVIPFFLQWKIIPSFQAIFAGMLEGASLPAFTRLVLASSSYAVAIQATMLLLIWFLAICYLGGPRLRAWFGRLLPGGLTLVDRILLSLPWRRKRLQRDFSAILAVSLEAGVPEPEAIRFAADSTANVVFRRRAQRASGLLAEGVTLPEAIRVLDRSGELQWRLANAMHGSGGFVKALTGWHEALEAKAFQLEQTAAQLTTTGFVLLNGVIIGGIVIGMFLPLIQLLNRVAIW